MNQTTLTTSTTSQYNYNALLQLLGFTHGQFIILLIVLFLISSFIYFLYKLGLITPIKFKSEILPSSHLVYLSYQGSYDVIQQNFTQVMSDINTIFKLSQPFGMYYDNPKQIQNPDQSRAIFGCLVNNIQKDKIKLFISKYPNYRYKQIMGQTQCIGTSYPFFNALSMILIITRVYPRLVQQVKRKKIQKSIGILQIYKIIEDKNQHVKILLPINNLSQFELWYPPQVQTQKINQSNVKNDQGLKQE